MSNKNESPRYLYFPDAVYFLFPISYKKEQGDSIRKISPYGNKRKAYREICQLVRELCGRLVSQDIPQRVLRKDAIEEVDNLKNHINQLIESLNSLSLINQKYLHHSVLDLNRIGFNIIDQKKLQQILEDFLEAITDIPDRYPRISGKKNMQFFWFIEELANIYQKYTGKEPTIHSIAYEVKYYITSSCQKGGGPFLNLIDSCLKPALESDKFKNSIERSGKNLSYHDSFLTLAREVVSQRKKLKSSK